MKSLIFLFYMAMLFFGEAAMVRAYIRPAAPIMDYVPQNLGIYDTYYQNFKESDCRVCHGASTAERHHGSQYALEGNCLFCHSAIPGVVPPERDCKVCHVDGGAVGDFGFPHHNSDVADSDQCNQCHNPNLLVETNTVDPPNYEPSSVTPSPYSCENCHWPSGKLNAHNPPPRSDWETWIGWPIPTYWPDGTLDPQPIEANGLLFSGDLWAGGKTAEKLDDGIGDEDGICDTGEDCVRMPQKNYAPLDGTHHEVQGKVFYKCYNCHGTAPDSDPDWEPTNPYLIRSCENCHSVGTLHAIKEHVTTNDIYSQAWNLNTKVKANQKCFACHGDNMLELPELPAEIPVINQLEPNFGSPGIVVDIIPATGTCYVEDPVNGVCSFGQKMFGDKVQMKQAGPGNPWIDVPIYSWSEHLIQIKIPASTFSPGNTQIRVLKQDVGYTTSQIFTVRKHPAINSLTPNMGNWDTVINIAGMGFGFQKQKIYPPYGYGFSTYVELHTSNDKYRVIKYSISEGSYPLWNDAGISFKVANLVDVNTGNAVPKQELYTGCWNLEVITDYFKDDGDGVYNENGHLDLQNSGNPADVPNPTGAGDVLLYREISDPVCFTVSNQPFISGISPNPVVSLNTVTVAGANFGLTRGTSIIKLWNKKHTLFSIVKNLKILSWNNTEIKFQVPANKSLTGKLKIKDVQIVLNPGTLQEKISNFYRLTILVAP